MDDELRSFANTLIEAASEIALNEEVGPLFVIQVQRNGKLDKLMMPLARSPLDWGSDFEKDRTRRVCRALVDVLKPVRVALVAEAWIASAQPGETSIASVRQRPSEREDRREAITVWAQEPGRMLSLMCEIERREGQPTKLGEILGGNPGDRYKLAPGHDFYDAAGLGPLDYFIASMLSEVPQETLLRESGDAAS
jgi:hypothetical protein